MASGSQVQANLLEAGRLLAEAASKGASLAVLPENFAHMGKAEPDTLDVAESPGVGPIQDFLADAARRHGLWIVGGTIPLRGETPNRVRAASLIFDDSGQQVGRYDKIHLFDVVVPETQERYAESETFEPGEKVLVIDSPMGRLGLAICYDLRFPELFRALLDQGAELVLVPSAFTANTGKAHWEVLLRARAIENLFYVAAAGQGGYHVNGRETYGHSMVIDPWGRVMVDKERPGGGVEVADIDLELSRGARRNFPCAEHRRFRCALDQSGTGPCS